VHFRVCSWLISLAKENSQKEKKPEQNHREQRHNGHYQTAEIGPRFLIPNVRRGAVRAEALRFEKRPLAGLADFEFHTP
jgi:hypothetical protein